MSAFQTTFLNNDFIWLSFIVFRVYFGTGTQICYQFLDVIYASWWNWKTIFLQIKFLHQLFKLTQCVCAPIHWKIDQMVEILFRCQYQNSKFRVYIGTGTQICYQFLDVIYTSWWNWKTIFSQIKFLHQQLKLTQCLCTLLIEKSKKR